MVSVIIPNYNHAPYLKQRIASVLNQTFQDFELIILDDCSTDNSKEIIDQFYTHSKVSHIVYNVINSGSTFKQWEKGIELAKGKYIWIAESDDYSDVSFLQTIVDILTKQNNVGIAFCNSYWIDGKGKEGEDLSLYNASFFKTGVAEVKDVLSRYCSIQNVSSCVVLKDLALEFVGGLGKYKACGDWIFYTRVLQNSDLSYTKEKLNYFRWYHHNISNSANKEGVWLYEGIDVLKEIDYKKVHFTIREHLSLMKFWIDRIRLSSIKNKPQLYLKVFTSFFQYSLSSLTKIYKSESVDKIRLVTKRF